MDAPRLAVQVKAHQPAFPAVAFDDEDPVAGGAELGTAAPVGDAGHVAAGGGHPVDAGFAGAPRAGEVTAAVLLEDHNLPVGREARTGVVTRRGDHRGCAPSGGNGADLAEAGVRPTDIDQLPAVRRPGRIGLHCGLVAGQATRLATRHRLDPELAEGLEHHRAPVGRDCSAPRHPGLEAVGRHGDLRPGRVDKAAGVRDPEGDDRALARGQVDPVELAAGPEDKAGRVRGPGHVGVDAGHRPGFLHVHVEGVKDLAVLPRGQVPDIEPGLGRLAADIGDLAAVRRRRGPHRAALAPDHALRPAGLEVIALDREELGVAVLGVFEDRARRGVAREIDAPAIGREDRLAQFLLVLFAGTLDQQHPVPAGDVVHPDLAGPEGSAGREVLLGDDVLAVRAPARLVHQPEALVGQLALVAPVPVHDPDVVAAAPV